MNISQRQSHCHFQGTERGSGGGQSYACPADPNNAGHYVRTTAPCTFLRSGRVWGEVARFADGGPRNHARPRSKTLQGECHDMSGDSVTSCLNDLIEKEFGAREEENV